VTVLIVKGVKWTSEELLGSHGYDRPQHAKHHATQWTLIVTWWQRYRQEDGDIIRTATEGRVIDFL